MVTASGERVAYLLCSMCNEYSQSEEGYKRVAATAESRFNSTRVLDVLASVGPFELITSEDSSLEAVRNLPHFQIDQAGDESEECLKARHLSLQKRQVNCAACDASTLGALVGTRQTESGMRITYHLCKKCAEAIEAGDDSIDRLIEQRLTEEMLKYGTRVSPEQFGH
jgi:hypothetical protein